jgi:Flp pilus assembly protein TadD
VAARVDASGLPVTTRSADALETYDRAVHALLGWDAGALDLFRAAVAADPGLAVAHAGAAVCLFLEERFEEARAAAATARAAAATATPRERAHVEGLARLVSGDAGGAETTMREHLLEHPRDILVAQRLYFVWFWQGRFPEMLELTSALSRDHDGPFMQGLHAFALEQAGRCDEAIALAETAIVRNPRDAWAVHALGHALFEAARFDAGITRLPVAIHPCTHLGWFRNHLLWHLTLLHLSRGDYARAATLSRTVFERRPSAIPGELHDSISLLWRLDLCGIDVSGRWAPFVDIARARLDRIGLLFHAVHLGMALAAGGDEATSARLLDTLRKRAARDATGITGGVAVPLLEGMQAFAVGDHARAIARLDPLGPDIWKVGGSRAQRDVFHDTLLAACLRAGDPSFARRLADRVGRRPDHFWRTRAAAST